MSGVINLRAPAALRALIDRAAELLGKSRTEFMLEAAREKAQQLLLDRTVFALDAGQFRRFNRLLDEPPHDDAALGRLLARKAPWDSKGR